MSDDSVKPTYEPGWYDMRLVGGGGFVPYIAHHDGETWLVYGASGVRESKEPPSRDLVRLVEQQS